MSRTTGVPFAAGAGTFSSTSSRLTVGRAELPIQWVPGVPSLRVKLPGREADH